MRHIKHFLAILLVLWCTVASAHYFEVDSIYYNITDATAKTVEVTYSGSSATSVNEYTGAEIIPSTVTYNGTTYSVTSIGTYAFYGCTGLTSVTIPNSVISIGYKAFYNCRGLTAVHINDLAAWCRIDFSSINSNPLSYAHNLYLNGEKVTDLVIPSDITEIKKYAFYGCTGLTSITIPNSVTSIGDEAFYDCTGLTSVTIGNSVTSIGDYAFQGCTGLTSITVNSGNRIYDSRKGCNAIIETATKTLIAGCKNTIIPNSVTSIKSRAFYGCTGLTSITIPNSVTSIGDEAFYDCTKLTSVTIGKGVTSIKSRAFYGCTGLKTVCNCSSLDIVAGNTVEGYVAYYADKVINAPNGSVEGDFVFGIKDGVKTLCGYIGNGGDVTLPENYNGGNYVIGAYAFQDNTTITGITISDGVTSIGSYAFAYCGGLTSVTIGNSVTSIGERAFSGCTGLTSVTIGNGVTSIGSYAFSSCTGLTSVTIGNGVTSIKPRAFYYCSGLTSVTIPAGVTAIGYDAFYCCSGLTSVAIGNSVTSIGDMAFAGCTGLRTVYNCSSLDIVMGSTDNGFVAYYADKVINAPNGSVEGDFVFGIEYGVKTLCGYIGNGGDVTLPENYNGGNYVIGAYAFQDNTTITGITISNSVTGIKYGAFYGCRGLTAVHINDLAAWCRIDFSSINSNPLSYAHNLYLNGEKVTDLVIPDDVKEIKDYAFNNCSGLTSVTIPNSVTSIGDDAFNRCWGLKEIYSLSAEPARITSTTFGNYSATLYVPECTKKIYENETEWNRFTNIVEIEVVDKDLEFTITSEDAATVAVTGYTGNKSSVIIPSHCTINGKRYTVTSIGNNAFDGYTGLASIKIPNTVTSIGDYAFSGCSGLTSIEIPNSVTSIGSYAFSGCSDLTSVTIPNIVTSIGNDAFEDCTGLTSITIPNSMTSISHHTFSGCSGLTSVTIPSSVTSIESWAFYGCTSLKTVYNCSSLNIVAGRTDNGYVAYYADEVINAPGSIVGDYKFTSANGVNTLVEYLGDGGDITLPENYNGENYVIGANAFKNNTAITSVTIPDGVTSIGNTAFYYCQNLTSVKLGKNVTTLGDFAFQYCTSLNDITLPNSLQAIGHASLSHCGFTNVVIPNKVKTIGDYAFDYCENLAQVTIGNCVTGIGHNAFYGCENLKTVTNNSSLNIVAGSTDNGYVAYYADKVITPPSISYTSLPAYFNTDNGLPGTIEGNNHIWESETMYFETPKSGIRITVFDINEGEYYNNFPMVALGELEFYDADGNKINYTASDVTTNSLESKEGSLAGLCDGDYSTFYHSTWSGEGTTPTDYVYLDVKFPQAVDAVSIKIVGRDNKRIVPTSIGITENGEYCEISAPTNGTCGESTTWSYNDGVLTISGSGAVTDKGWNKYINNIIGVVIEEGITSIMDDAFLRYSNLTSATLPGTLAVLPQGVFSRTGLTGIEIPEGVTTLGMWAFDNCPALATVTLPTTLTSISDYAFENCTALASVTSNAVIAPILGANVFGGIAEGATLTYPQGSDYSSWSDYFTISLFTPGDINGDSEVNVGDFASLVNLIFNSDNIDAATMAVADINGDGEVNVGDFAGLVNLIFNSGSQAAPKRAAALAATVEPSLYIEPFSIAPGEQKQIEVLLDNPGEKFSQLQFDLALPEGVEIVFDEDNFCYTIDRGSRLASVYNIDAQDVNGGVKVLALTTNPKAYIKGESGDVLLITVQAADDIADGVYDLSIDNVVLSHQDGSTVKAASTTAAITVSSTTGITNVEGAEDSYVYYDLQGRVVKEPSNGFYIVNGKKVFIK